MTSETAERLPRARFVVPPRTKLQIEADAFDLDLYRLLSRAEAKGQGTGPVAARWREIARDLHNARTGVREMMHPTDRAVTHD